MRFFGKKKLIASPLDLSWLYADMHSHLIPGIDDGAPDMDTSIQLIKGLQELGYSKLITTPHVLWDVYANTSEQIKEGVAALQNAVKAEKIQMEITAAAEYFIDEHFESGLQDKTPLLPLSGNLVLVEFSMVTAPLDLLQILFQTQIQGYQPVIAHPERYIYLAGRRQFFDELKSAGCFFQLNLLSLTGHYGKSVQELAEYLCKKEYYDLAGTDLHNERHLTALQKLSASPTFLQLKDSGTLKNDQL